MKNDWSTLWEKAWAQVIVISKYMEHYIINLTQIT